VSHPNAFSAWGNLQIFFEILHRSRGTRWFLQGTRDHLITKQRIHLLQCSAIGIGVEGCIANCGDDVEHKGCVEISEADRVDGNWRDLSNGETNAPVRDGS
jgi:hypothetical protein